MMSFERLRSIFQLHGKDFEIQIPQIPMYALIYARDIFLVATVLSDNSVFGVSKSPFLLFVGETPMQKLRITNVHWKSLTKLDARLNLFFVIQNTVIVTMASF